MFLPDRVLIVDIDWQVCKTNWKKHSLFFAPKRLQISPYCSSPEKKKIFQKNNILYVCSRCCKYHFADSYWPIRNSTESYDVSLSSSVYVVLLSNITAETRGLNHVMRLLNQKNSWNVLLKGDFPPVTPGKIVVERKR